ncbi:MAG: hypothetical protein ACK5XN_07090 [Bacteroidota bacterium]|jgi:transcriptional regulator with XRE-family HTH domain
MGKETVNKRLLIEKLNALAELSETNPPEKGWLAAIRMAFDLTLEEFGEEIKMTKQGVLYIEKQERKGSVTLKKLREVGKVLGFKLVYALVPENGTFDALLKDRERAKDVHVIRYKKINKNFCNTEPIELANLDSGDIAFPSIDYRAGDSLHLPKTTLHAAYRNIKKNVKDVDLSDLNWEERGNIEWQNAKLQSLADEIMRLIEEYLRTSDSALLRKIFILIHLWGGNAGRGFFIRNNGFTHNFKEDLYLKAIAAIQEKEYQEALDLLNQMPWMNTSFSSKHLHFWSRFDAPIFDSIISSIVFGRKTPNAAEYSDYIDSLNDFLQLLDNPNLTRSDVERCIFNWANTPAGKEWISNRID